MGRNGPDGDLQVPRVMLSKSRRVPRRQTAPSYAASVAEVRGGWQRFGERTVYDNRWVRLGLVDVEAPNGERWEYHVVHLDRIAVALIVDDEDRVLISGSCQASLRIRAACSAVGGCGFGLGCGGGTAWVMGLVAIQRHRIARFSAPLRMKWMYRMLPFDSGRHW